MILNLQTYLDLIKIAMLVARYDEGSAGKAEILDSSRRERTFEVGSRLKVVVLAIPSS